MPLVPLRLLLDHAAENNYGLAAFNVNNMEQIQAIMEAAKETDAPVIVQASRGAAAIPRMPISVISCWPLRNSIRKFPSPCTRITATVLKPVRAPSNRTSPR